MMKNKGIIAVNKPSGWTSFDVVNKIKHLLKMSKVGHLGTLDPMATGLLLVTVGRATKLFDLMQEKTKTYIAKFKYGEETDTLDATGKVINTSNIIPTLSNINAVIPEFIGRIEQLPPKYSAKSINGKRAYDLARANVDFELKPVNVTIHSMNVLDFTDGILTIEIECGSGTYIRSICRDIAYQLNTFANMIELTRTKIDNFTINQAVEISELNSDNIYEYVHNINEILSLPLLVLNDNDMFKLLNGQILNLDKNDGLYKLNNDIDTIALVKISKKQAKMSIFLG